MQAQLTEALAKAALNETERRAIARVVAILEEELGDDLLAVWLYGSRARGEADPSETHFDRRSDIDMMAIVGPGRDASAFSWEFTPKLIAAVEAEGDSPPYYSMHFHQLEVVDRSSPHPQLLLRRGRPRQDRPRRRRPGGGRVPVSPRSQEFMDQARDRAAAAAELFQAGHIEIAVSSAYYAMLYAARAALSEDDESARTHRGRWNAFRLRMLGA